MTDKIEIAQSKVVEQIEKYQRLNEKTTIERESLLRQITDGNEIKNELQNHISTLEVDGKEVRFSLANSVVSKFRI